MFEWFKSFQCTCEKSSNGFVNIPDSLSSAVDLSKVNNPDLIIAKIEYEQSEQDVQIARSDLTPTASLSFERTHSEDLSSTYDEREKDVLKATVSWPFYTGGKNIATLNKNKNLNFKHILSKEVFIVPKEKNIIQVGATYERDYLSRDITSTAADFLIQKTKKII